MTQNYVVSERIAALVERIDKDNQNLAAGRNLPAECYVDEEFYRFEQEAIFARTWLCLGRSDEVKKPGDFVRIDLGDEPLVMVRDNQGKIRVLSPVCAHRGHIVCEGSGNAGRLFRCPFHAWLYDLDGRLVAAPSMNSTVGLASLKEEACLPSHQVEEWNGFVFANLDPDAAPLGPTLARLTEALAPYHLDELVSTPTIDVPGNPWNWKAQLENGIEPYHSVYLHLLLHDFAPLRLASFVEMSPDEGCVYHPTGFVHIDAGFNPTTKALFPVIPTLSEADRSQVIFASIPPTLGFGAVPEGLFYYLVLPDGPGKMTLRIGMIYPSSSLDHPLFEHLRKIQNDALALFQVQDGDATASVQRGNRSRFRQPGRYSHQEESLFQLNRWLIKRYKDFIAIAEGDAR